ncbi:MAG: cytochrome P450 [Crocosphaera sp.]|nr:cytochrome P450 [Crocosphaera sp.]
MTSTFTLPPGPSTSPMLQSKEWIDRPIDFWEDCLQQYGEFFTVQLGSLGSVIVISNPEAARQVFALSPKLFECHQYNEHYKYVMGENSVLVQDGERHKQQRKLLVPPLQVDRLKIYAEKICQITRQITDKWTSEKPFSVRLSMHELSLKVILDIVFGSSEVTLKQQIIGLFSSQIFQDLGSWSPWARFGKLHPLFRKMIAAAINKRRENFDPNCTDIFNLLVSMDTLSDAEIQDHIFTFYIAGVDTVALGLSWALYWIHQTPEIRQKIRQELNSLPPDAEPMAITKLPYLTATCQEVLRMYPVVSTPIGRKLTAPVQIMDYNFEPGITLLPCTYLVHHREDIYPNPHSFQPERFLSRQYAPYEYFPFGGGNRLCIGAGLAPMELKLVLATILSRFEFISANEGEVKPVRHGTMLAPSDNMKLQIIHREY